MPPPYRWEAGMENLKGRLLYAPGRPGIVRFTSGPIGECLVDFVIKNGLFTPGESEARALRPFVEELFNHCGCPLPDWLIT